MQRGRKKCSMAFFFAGRYLTVWYACMRLKWKYFLLLIFLLIRCGGRHFAFRQCHLVVQVDCFGQYRSQISFNKWLFKYLIDWRTGLWVVVQQLHSQSLEVLWVGFFDGRELSIQLNDQRSFIYGSKSRTTFRLKRVAEGEHFVQYAAKAPNVWFLIVSHSLPDLRSHHHWGTNPGLRQVESLIHHFGDPEIPDF